MKRNFVFERVIVHDSVLIYSMYLLENADLTWCNIFGDVLPYVCSYILV